MNLKRKIEQVHHLIKRLNHDLENTRKRIKLTYIQLKSR